MAVESKKEEKKRKQDQNAVLRDVLFAILFLSCSVTAAVSFPFPKLRLPTLLDRVVFTLRCLMLSVLTILAGVSAVANKRFSTAAINPLDPSGKALTEMRQRYRQNTVEQFLIHSFSLLTLSTYLSEEKMHLIPLLVVLFMIARAVLFVGYSADPKKGTLGFTMTYTQNVFVTGYCLYCMFAHGVQASHFGPLMETLIWPDLDSVVSCVKLTHINFQEDYHISNWQ